MKAAVAVALAALILTACSNTQEASKSNFRDALKDYADHHPVCMPITDQAMAAAPGTVEGSLGDPFIRVVTKDQQGNKINEDILKQMKVLTGADIYDKEKDEIRPGAWKNNAEISVKVYKLTEKGAQKAFLTTPQGRQLCVGKQKIDKVNWFTSPAASNGMNLSQVSYQGSYDLDGWAKDLLEVNPKIIPVSLKDKFEGKALMVQTSDGWKDVRTLH